MTYQQNCTLPNDLVEQIMMQGLDAVPEMIGALINLAMQMERQAYLGVGPYERSPERRDSANGYKPKLGLDHGNGRLRFFVTTT